MTVAIAIEFFIIHLGWRHQRRLRATVVRTGGRLCTTCGYDMTDAPERCHCTECGTAYSMHDAIRAWTEWGFRPYDEKNPAPKGIRRKYWKLTAFSIGMIVVILAGTNLWLWLRNYMNPRDADPHDDLLASMELLMANWVALLAANMLVILMWIAIALEHHWKSRKLWRRHISTLEPCRV